MQELIKHFGIDARLLLAQAVNFLILLFLLKKFAYRPILAMLAKRRAEIEKGFELRREAEQMLAEADHLKEATLQEARIEALEMVNDAEAAAKMRRDEIVQEAAKKSEGIVTDAKRIIGQEKAIMEEEVYANAHELVREAIVKVIGRIPNEERDRVLIEEALRELRSRAV